MERTERAAACAADGYSGEWGLMRFWWLAPFALLATTQFAKACPGQSDDPVWLLAACDLSNNEPGFRDELLVWVSEKPDRLPAWLALSGLLKGDYVAYIDWKFDTPDILWDFERLLAKKGAPPFTVQESEKFTEIGKEAWGESVPMAELEGPLADAIKARGYRLLYIDTQSDQYTYAIVSELQYCRWSGVNWGGEVTSTGLDEDAMLLGFDASIGAVTKPHICSGEDAS